MWALSPNIRSGNYGLIDGYKDSLSHKTQFALNPI